MKSSLARITLGCVVLGASVAFAGDVVEEQHETVEKRSMKIETVPPPPPPVQRKSTVEEEESHTTTRQQAPPSTVIEKRTIEVPPAVHERSVETYEKKEK